MKVLHFNQSDIVGGASIAGYRLHQGLREQGIDSKLLVGEIKTDSQYISLVPSPSKFETRILARLSNNVGLNYLHILNGDRILKHSFFREADILNFHNLHGGYFNYLAISKLTRDKPAILTLHDMWSFTGHCSYSYDCDRWKTGCGKCPYPETYPAINQDHSGLEWKLKNWTYSRANLTIVSPSRWLAEQAQASLLSRFPIRYIPHGIDTTAYQPLDTWLCKAVLGIPENKFVLLFCAATLHDKRKGQDLLFKALQQLPQALKTECILLTLGRGPTVPSEVGIPILSLGYVGSDLLKSLVYSAADLFIFPTRADNLPLVVQESMACGTPTVSFKVGGVPDLVRQNITGYLAQPEDVSDLCHGIEMLIADEPLRHQMSENCRKVTLEEYSLALQATRYIELYKQTLESLV